MNIVPVGRPLAAFWEELFYLNASLRSNSKTVGLGRVVEGRLATFDAIERADREVRGVVLMSQAGAAAAEDNIGELVRDLYMLVLVEVRNSRKDERYTKLMSVSESIFVRYNFDVKKTEVMRMKSVLKQSIYGDVFRDRANTILDGILLEIEGALSEELEMVEKRAQHRVDVNVWKNETNRVRLEVYAELIGLAGSDKKAWARGFFLKPVTRKKLSASEDADLEVGRARKRTAAALRAFEQGKERLAAAETAVALVKGNTVNE